jgi:hypothetical protein
MKSYLLTFGKASVSPKALCIIHRREPGKIFSEIWKHRKKIMLFPPEFKG